MALQRPVLLLDLLRPCAGSSKLGQRTAFLPLIQRLQVQPYSVSSFSIPRPAATPYRLPLLSRSSAVLHLSRRSASTSPPGLAGSLDPEHASLTPFQLSIAALETAALQAPESADKQLALLRALLDGEEYQGLCRYYEVVALGSAPDGPHGSADTGAGGVQSKAVLGSEEAFGMYVEALGQLGRLGDVPAQVRKRDGLLRDQGVRAVPDPYASPSTNHTTMPPAAAAEHTASASSTAKTAAASRPPSILSRVTSTVSSALRPSRLASPPTSGNAVPAAPAALGAVGAAGTPLQPIYVQIAPPSPASAVWKTIRFLLMLCLFGFISLTLFSFIADNMGIMKMNKGPAEFEPEDGKVVTFADIHGVEEAKNELEEIVEFLKNPEKFSTLGGKLPKGVLLTGPPGTGKTMLARAVAGEAGVPFFFASGSGFEEMFVGVGAKRVRELFAAAKQRAPAIVFIDELDAIGSKRSARDAHYMKQTLNQLLVELDGFEQTEGVIIIAATNFPESLDKALTRPGRFDRHVTVSLPDVRGRIAILKQYMDKVAFDTAVDPSIIARGTPGMSGADLQNLVNQAAVKASREGLSSVQLKHFEWAKDRILMGAERRSHYVTEESKRATAYHEGGHALVALHTPGAMPLHKVTIMPRGQALGITFQLPEQDKDSYSRKEYTAMIDVSMGGRAAEELILGEDNITSGCSSDLQNATNVAVRMVRQYGMSDKVGLVAHGDEESVYLSGKKKDEIEGEIKFFLNAGYDRARTLLKRNEEQLHRLAKALVEYEELSLEEVRKVINGERLTRAALQAGQALLGVEERRGNTGEIVETI